MALNGASVYAYGLVSGDYLGSGYTDSTGAFTIKPLPTNVAIYLSVSPPYDHPELMDGYYNVTAPNFFTPFNASKSNFKLTANRTGLLIRDPVGNVISGKITKTGGAAVAYVFVQAYNSANGTGSYTSTAADGTYKLQGLPNGTYKVTIGSPTPTYTATTIVIVTGGYYNAGVATTHYSATTGTGITFP